MESRVATEILHWKAARANTGMSWEVKQDEKGACTHGPSVGDASGALGLAREAKRSSMACNNASIRQAHRERRGQVTSWDGYAAIASGQMIGGMGEAAIVRLEKIGYHAFGECSRWDWKKPK